MCTAIIMFKEKGLTFSRRLCYTAHFSCPHATMLITSVTTTHLHSICEEEFPDRVIYFKLHMESNRPSTELENPPGFYGTSK